MIRFIFSALWYGCAYIDLDGCLIYRMRCPRNLGLRGIDFLLWWRENLGVRPIIKQRLPLLYFLRFMCVRLVVWTNRDRTLHHHLTLESLGKHIKLFDDFQYFDGTKILTRVPGPVMDDQEKYLICGKGYGYLVKQL